MLISFGHQLDMHGRGDPCITMPPRTEGVGPSERRGLDSPHGCALQVSYVGRVGTGMAFTTPRQLSVLLLLVNQQQQPSGFFLFCVLINQHDKVLGIFT